jgi:hypothetical protein
VGATFGKRRQRHESWNFGNGRKLEYAYKCALQCKYGGGHFATVKAYSDRCRIFAQWCASSIGPGVKDAREIHNPILYEYAAHLSKLVEQGEIAVSTAVNRLSSVNIGMEALRGDRHVRVPSPSESLGMRASGFARPSRKDRIARRYRRSSMCCVTRISYVQRQWFKWREPLGCGCAKPYWLIYLG